MKEILARNPSVLSNFFGKVLKNLGNQGNKGFFLPNNVQRDCFFLWYWNYFNFRFQFFPDLCFRIYLWSWRPYMRILWILDQTRNSFWRQSFFKQVFVQKCHIKVCCGLIWRQIFVVSKMTATAWKGTKYTFKII